MSFIENFIARSTTERLAKGITKEVRLSDEEFTNLMNKFSKKMKQTGEYEIPNWFTIEFVHEKDNLYKIISTFHEGKDYNKVYKEEFLNILKNNNIKFEKINDNKEIYKIFRH